MEIFVRAELKRAAERHATADKAAREAEIANRTASMLAEHMRTLCKQIRIGFRPMTNFPVQQDSDLRAAEKARSHYAAEHEQAESRDRLAAGEFRDAQINLWDLQALLAKLIRGEERWESVGDVPCLPDGYTYRTFDDGAGTSHHFKQTWSPPSQPDSPSPPPPSHESPPPQQALKRPAHSRDHAPDQNGIDAWFAEVKAALANSSRLTSFPQPPRWTFSPTPNDKWGCPIRALGLCDCGMRELFDGRDLKADRALFHPDKWMRVPDEIKKEVQDVVGDVFKWVVGAYVRKIKTGKEKAGGVQ